jgi:hypothetical protein
MEILFVGGLLVALMVYVSTRIKKSAAAAFERETIETEEIRLVKPEGFINPVSENSQHVFEARSKDYGENKAGRDAPRAKFTISVFENGDFQKICQDTKESSGRVLTENSPHQTIYLLETEQTADETDWQFFHKIVESKRQQKVFDLKISVLHEFRDEYNDKIKEILDNFVVK